jgi:hypothetical protein
MPQGIATEVVGGYAYVTFLDESLRGVVLGKLITGDVPVDTDTSGRRKRYRIPEGNAREHGLIDAPRKRAPKKAALAKVTAPAVAIKSVEPPVQPNKAPPAKKAQAKKAPPTKPRSEATPELKADADGVQDQIT